jgi:hypothetical protein
MSSNDNEEIKNAVSNILKIDPMDHMKIYNFFEKLRKENKDDKIIDAIQKIYKEKKDEADKLSSKIQKKLLEKYPNESTEEYIEKINGYQKKYKFDNDVKKLIINSIFKTQKSNVHHLGPEMPYTAMSKTLGYKPQQFSYTTGQMRVEAKDMEYLDGIIAIRNATRELHNRVKLQSFVYNLGSELTQYSSAVNRRETDIFNFIHPVLFALYSPKFDIIEQRTILTSIPDLIYKLKEGQPLETMPEIDMYDDICRDPVDNACTKENSPFMNLLQRSKVQTLLWKEVMNLREGRYYNNTVSSFLDNLNECVKNTYAPDFTYVKDPGTIIRALYSVFSLRTINVCAVPEMTVLGSPILTTIQHNIFTTIPMLNVMIPSSNNPLQLGQSVSLKNYLQTPTRFRQNGRSLVMKMQKVHHCYDLLTFYVPRKELGTTIYQTSKPYLIQKIPMSTAGLEKINKTKVSADDMIDVGQDTFKLRSVVVMETVQPKILGNEELITGCGTLVRLDNDSGSCWLYYSPLGIVHQSKDFVKNDHGPTPKALEPLSFVKDEDALNNMIQDFGTVYIYSSHSQKLEKSNMLCL